MDLVGWNVRVYPTTSSFNHNPNLFSCICNYPSPIYCHRRYNEYSSITVLTHAKNKIQHVTLDDVKDEDEFLQEFEEDDLLITDEIDDEEFLEDDDEDYFEDEYVTEDAQVYAGDGAEGGGISLAGTWWDKEALTIAENVVESFDGELGIYGFRTLANARIQVRIEKLLTKSGSPSMSDIEAFSAAYRTRLDEAELAKTIHENIYLESQNHKILQLNIHQNHSKQRTLGFQFLRDVADESEPFETNTLKKWLYHPLVFLGYLLVLATMMLWRR